MADSASPAAKTPARGTLLSTEKEEKQGKHQLEGQQEVRAEATKGHKDHPDIFVTDTGTSAGGGSEASLLQSKTGNHDLYGSEHEDDVNDNIDHDGQHSANEDDQEEEEHGDGTNNNTLPCVPRGVRMVVGRDIDDVSARAGTLVASRILEEPELRVLVTVASSCLGTFQHLSKLVDAGTVDTSQTTFVVMDEYYTDAVNGGSNQNAKNGDSSASSSPATPLPTLSAGRRAPSDVSIAASSLMPAPYTPGPSMTKRMLLPGVLGPNRQPAPVSIVDTTTTEYALRRRLAAASRAATTAVHERHSPMPRAQPGSKHAQEKPKATEGKAENATLAELSKGKHTKSTKSAKHAKHAKQVELADIPGMDAASASASTGLSLPVASKSAILEFDERKHEDTGVENLRMVSMPKPGSHRESRPHLAHLRRQLFDRLNVKPNHLLAPPPSLAQAPSDSARREAAAALDREVGVAAACSTFDSTLSKTQIDLALVVLRTDGCIGWIPSPAEIKEGGNEAVIIDISDQPLENYGYDYAITVTLATLMKAKEILLFAIGRNKAEILGTSCKASSDLGSAPTVAAYLLANHPRVLVFADVGAASALRQPPRAKPRELMGFRILDRLHFPAPRRIVCFAGHPDDTSIGCGATLAMLATDERNHVRSCIVTTGHHAFIPGTTTAAERISIREQEAAAEAAILGCAGCDFLRAPMYDTKFVTDKDVAIVEAYLRRIKPDVIFMHNTGDSHPTHSQSVQVILLALMNCFAGHPNGMPRLYRSPVRLFMFEGPWAFLEKHHYNTISSPTRACFDAKLNAIRASPSQTARTRYDTAARSLARLRGALVPEMDLAGFGGDPARGVPQLEPHLEIFYTVRIDPTSAHEQLRDLLARSRNKEQPPSSLSISTT